MEYKQELEQIRQDHGGVLRAADVVQFARDPETALHGRFEWDDTRAAEQYRLCQARELIRVVVQTRESDRTPVRMYVSIERERHQEGGGYRAMDDVMRNDAMRAALLKQAHTDMVRFEQTYRQLNELAGVMAAMRAARRRCPEKQPA